MLSMSRRTRCLTHIGLVTGTLLSAGCYTLQPVGGASLTPNDRVAFDVTDVGRVALGGAMGPSIMQIEGRLLRQAPDSLVVAVSSVSFLNGGSQAWSGESVALKPEYVGVSYQRRLSKSRTFAAAAIGVGAVAFIVTRSLVTGGDPATPPPPPPEGSTHRGPRP
jgi:hypothetical protein